MSHRSGSWLLLGIALTVASCHRKPPPGTQRVDESLPAPRVAAPPAPVDSSPGAGALAEKEAALLDALEKDKPSAPAGNEPRLGVMSTQAQIYAGPSGSKETRLGYVRGGARIAAQPQAMPGEGCAEGWYRLVPVGYICGRHVTFDANDRQVRLGLVAPKLEDVLPYTYGRNGAHGTPLYKNVPSREELSLYESPDRNSTEAAARRRAERLANAEKKKKKKTRSKGRARDERETEPKTKEEEPIDELAASPFGGGFSPAAVAPPALALEASGEPAANDRNRPWWARSYDGNKPDIKLSDLLEDADGVLAKRMVSGFYVAVDRTFLMNGRTWFKTTGGLVTPAERFSIVKPTALTGQEIDAAHAQNAVAFVLSKEASKYNVNPDNGSARPLGALARYDRAFLTGKAATLSGKLYRETIDGWWLRASDGTITEPAVPPPDLAANEKWIDVNLSRQTVVAFEGTRPVFATILSSGRRGADKEHDHRTPKGTWRVREKHITATMDGDGAAAGDLPYSIEDVPYILYFFESYALHGAFWHDNFGHQQSHGCLNLSPLDAKRLFLWSDPQIPTGWHGMFSSPEMPGSRVVVHD